MRILFDSKKKEYKRPFGSLTPEQRCDLHIHIPAAVQTSGAECVFLRENGEEMMRLPLSFEKNRGPYDVWMLDFSFSEAGLYFYYFRITGNTGTFRLYKQGDDTNMEAGDLWQVSCVPADFVTPDWAKGAIIYQVFPDRFAKAGECDLTGKLQPYTVHEKWDEEVSWQPTPEGEVLNNDFYGGNFRGITEKLDYLASLGVGILYLNPISKSFSSHRYDTGDYKTPDPMLGTVEDFKKMCAEAHKRGIRVVLDGVFSHTGSDSLYFDKNRSFGGKGAYWDKKSPYYSWYSFSRWPEEYNSWWGFDTLPTVNKLDPAFMEYIITGEDSVVAHWLSMGADGFRLDVADELPNEFMASLKKRVREIKPDALVMGEVWEDASNKIAYDVRRRYFVDGTLDSVMNYPCRKAILRFVRGEDDGGEFRRIVRTIGENYPAQALSCCMNLLGSHDTPRILTALMDDYDGPREELAKRKLSPEQRELARQRLMMATFLQYTLPGCPSIYYGDEAMMEGGKDPFNRRTYPWGKADMEMLGHFRMLGNLRKDYPQLGSGSVRFFRYDGGCLGFNRKGLRVYVNNSQGDWEIPGGDVIMGHKMTRRVIHSLGWCIVEED